MYLKYKVQKYIHVFCILQGLYKIQNVAMWNNFFLNDINTVTVNVQQNKQIVLMLKQQFLKRSISTG